VNTGINFIAVLVMGIRTKNHGVVDIKQGSRAALYLSRMVMNLEANHGGIYVSVMLKIVIHVMKNK
jgi:hypothetical protein